MSKQVLFKSDYSDGIHAGIQEDNGDVICACCGGVIEIDEIYEFAPAEIAQPIFPYHSWCDITEDIIGGEMPEEWCKIYGDPTPEESEPVESWYFANLSDKAD